MQQNERVPHEKIQASYFLNHPNGQTETKTDNNSYQKLDCT